MGRCDVCGQEGRVVACCSSLGAVSCSYCIPCHRAGREPYGVIVGCLAGIGARSLDDVDPELRAIVEASMKVAGKTLKELFRDVAELEAVPDVV